MIASELLTTQEAANLLKLSKSTLNHWRTTGRGPSFVRLGRVVRYEPKALTDWAAQTRCNSTAPYTIGKAIAGGGQ